MPRPTIAVIVPTLDEAARIASTLDRARPIADELIVSDGGSRDGTLEIANRLGGTVVSGPPGRGEQLNRGARAATSDVLLFLHADTLLPDSAATSLAGAVEAGCTGGGFHVRFGGERGIARVGSGLVKLRTRLTRCPLGDQAQFCLRTTFLELGGFRDWPILEDLDFIRRLKRQGKIALLSPPVETSFRRYERRGIARTIATNWLIFGLYFLGVSPVRLARLYRRPRREL